VSTDPRYSAEVLRRLRETPGAGDLAPHPHVVRGRAGEREQGVEVQLACAIEAGRVTAARFRAFGCPHVLAAASWLTERLPGARREDLLAWDWREAADALEVPPAKFGRLLTLQDALREIGRNWPVEPQSTV
jgi:NifU-like protein involved in Fe-S cluster formation